VNENLSSNKNVLNENLIFNLFFVNNEKKNIVN